jgi:hypothetical protein
MVDWFLSFHFLILIVARRIDIQRNRILLAARGNRTLEKTLLNGQFSLTKTTDSASFG